MKRMTHIIDITSYITQTTCQSYIQQFSEVFINYRMSLVSLDLHTDMDFTLCPQLWYEHAIYGTQNSFISVWSPHPAKMTAEYRNEKSSKKSIYPQCWLATYGPHSKEVTCLGNIPHTDNLIWFQLQVKNRRKTNGDDATRIQNLPLRGPALT